MRKLNTRSLKILKAAEEAKDHTVALHAVRECRRNLELIAKLTGELDPQAAGKAGGQRAGRQRRLFEYEADRERRQAGARSRSTARIGRSGRLMT